MLDLKAVDEDSQSQSSNEEAFVIKEEEIVYKRKHSDVAKISA